MGFSDYNPHQRYRRRAFERMTGVAVIVACMGLAAVIGFLVGRQYIVDENSLYKDEVSKLVAERDQLRDAVTELKAEALTANSRYTQLEESYKQTVPAGPVEELLKLVRKQLDEGMDPERLAFLLRSARPPRNCSDPEIQHFVLSTPTYQGAESTVTIADKAIVVKGQGESAKNDKGGTEAWYDPTKSVSLEFTINGGRNEVKSGVMPIYHAVVIGGREYRFTVEPGARSFAKVTFDSCDYP